MKARWRPRLRAPCVKLRKLPVDSSPLRALAPGSFLPILSSARSALLNENRSTPPAYRSQAPLARDRLRSTASRTAPAAANPAVPGSGASSPDGPSGLPL